MKKIKMGIVGLGRLGKRHAENVAFKVPGAELLAACSVSDSEIKYAKDNLGVKYVYKDYDEMLQNKELDAIFVSSSSNVHCVQIEKALNAGFHVLSEKPLGVNIEEAVHVKEVVEAHPDQVFMLGFMRRYDKSYSYAKKMIDEGKIGKPFLIRCYGLDPDSQALSVIPFLKTSGGLFQDMASHDVDLARWFLGKEAKSVYAVGGCYKYPEYAKEGDIDNGVAIINFEENMICMLYVGRTAPHGYQVETEIVGTEGTLRIAGIPEKNHIAIYNNSGVVRECSQDFLERFEDAYVNEVIEFTSCIVENRRPGVGVIDGINAAKITGACQKAYETGSIVEI